MNKNQICFVLFCFANVSCIKHKVRSSVNKLSFCLPFFVCSLFVVRGAGGGFGGLSGGWGGVGGGGNKATNCILAFGVSIVHRTQTWTT